MVEREIIIGLVGGIGVDFDSVISCLKKELLSQEFNPVLITLSELTHPVIKKYSNNKSELKRIRYYMSKATDLRQKCSNAILALLAMAQINHLRDVSRNKNNIYILKSLKRPEEVEVLRKTYGRNFILISVHSSNEHRTQSLCSKESKVGSQVNQNKTKKEIKKLIKKDFDETDKKQKKWGQKVSATFPRAHIFVNTDSELEISISRFIDILFGHPFHTPTKDERNMFVAHGIALRSADLSRQVGAVISNEDGDIIATGCNDVPKFGGGFYEPFDKDDLRDFKYKGGEDQNVKEKLNILKDILSKFFIIYKNDLKLSKSLERKIQSILKNNKQIYFTMDALNSRITDLLEFGRMVHAEAESICDAARRGIKLKGATLYCTTYPCHLCAKLILAVGIRRVVYIDPYPKSFAKKLYEGVITETTTNRKSINSCLIFDAFTGIAPRRYLNVFRQMNRKQKDKLSAKPTIREQDSPYLKARTPLNYILRELSILVTLKKILKDKKIKIKKTSTLNKILNDDLNEKFKKITNEIKNINEWAKLTEEELI